MKVIIHKTKVMSISLGRKQRFGIDGKTLELVKKYVNLGQVATSKLIHASETPRSTKMGWITYGRISQIINCNLPLTLKRKVYNRCI